MAAASLSPSNGFVWQPEYDGVLEKIAATDVVETEWTRLKDIVKYKIEKNVELFLSESEAAKSATPETERQFSLEPSTPGGLKLPPFPPRTAEAIARGPPVPKVQLTEDEVNEQKSLISEQLESFEDGPPFTIQRLAELCLNRRQHYASLGKYLRAVEKTLLVTSSWAPAPPHDPSTAGPGGAALSFAPAPDGGRSAPTTPLFSPIPFLHADARRSQSRSPPLLALEPSAVSSAAGAAPIVLDSELTGAIEPSGLGLVDELDDPRPGHMSDTPTALSSVTTIPEAGEGKEDGKEGKPLFGTLEDRFVKGGKEVAKEGTDAMELDTDNSKEAST